MALEQLPHGTDPSANTMSKSPHLRTASGHQRQALARVAALLAERDELLHGPSAWRNNAASRIAGPNPFVGLRPRNGARYCS